MFLDLYYTTYIIINKNIFSKSEETKDIKYNHSQKSIVVGRLIEQDIIQK